MNDELLVYRLLKKSTTHGVKNDLNFVDSAGAAMAHKFATPLVILFGF